MFRDTPAFSGFSVDDISKARQFYGEILGLEIDEEPKPEMPILGLKLGSGAKVVIYAKGSEHQPATYTILNFPVENIDKAISELEEKGIEFIKYDNPNLPQDEKGVLRGLSNNMGPDITWFKDPAGNVLSVLQDKT